MSQKDQCLKKYPLLLWSSLSVTVGGQSWPGLRSDERMLSMAVNIGVAVMSSAMLAI